MSNIAMQTNSCAQRATPEPENAPSSTATDFSVRRQCWLCDV